MGPYPLVHYHYDVFQVPETSDGFAAGEKFQFEMNKKGDIDRCHAELEPALGEDIVFLRAPDKISQAVAQSLTGDYPLSEMTATVSLATDGLRLTVPGQLQVERVSKNRDVEVGVDLDAGNRYRNLQGE